MIACAVYGCTNNTLTTTDPSIQYYYFPKHPVVAQQWIAACCWSAEQIDISTARICSIHFDTNSYTSEYKMLDYLGCYTKVLKYDAVPTLYLPNSPSPSIIIKTDIEEPVNVQDSMKNIIVYAIPSGAIEANPAENFINVQEQQNKGIEENNTQETDLPEEYKHIKDVNDLERLKEENENLRKHIEQLQPAVEKQRIKAAEKESMLQKSKQELNKLLSQCHAFQKASLSIQEQKNILSKVFSESQIKILNGKKKIYWSNDDMAIGYTIRHMSNKRCYTYLTKNLNIPLPALSSIKRWATLKKSESMKKDDTFEASE